METAYSIEIKNHPDSQMYKDIDECLRIFEELNEKDGKNKYLPAMCILSALIECGEGDTEESYKEKYDILSEELSPFGIWPHSSWVSVSHVKYLLEYSGIKKLPFRTRVPVNSGMDLLGLGIIGRVYLEEETEPVIDENGKKDYRWVVVNVPATLRYLRELAQCY